MAQKPTTWAKNPERLARLMGLPMTRGKKKRASLELVKQWMADPTFPKKTRHGYKLEEVRKWRVAQAKNGASDLPATDKPAEGDFFESDAEGWERTLDQWEEKLNHPEKWLKSPIQQWQLKKLEKYRPKLFGQRDAGPDSPAAAEAAREDARPTMMIPDRIARQSDLASFLHEYFRGRLAMKIDATTLDQWRHRLRLEPLFIDLDGTGLKWVKPPKFPEKTAAGNYWDTHECIEWVERWIIPAKGLKDGKSDLPGMGGIDFTSAKEEHELWKMQRERDIADGQFKSVALFNQVTDRLGLAINQSLTAHMEKNPEKQLIERLKGIVPIGNLENFLPQIEAAFREVCRASADALRNAIGEALTGGKVEPTASSAGGPL